MAFGIRSFFPGANFGLRQFVPRLNLTPPVSVRTLTANAAIAAKYDQLGGFKGALGVALSDVRADSPTTFTQYFCGGNIHFLDNGQTPVAPLFQARINYKGLHCFGNPGFGKSDSVYLIVVVYPPSNLEQAVVIKIPDDGGDNLFDDVEVNQDRTEGIRQIWGGTVPPTSVVITAMVLGSAADLSPFC